MVHWIQEALGEDSRLRIVDSAPIPVCRNVRGNRCKTFGGEASWGYCAAQGTWFYGLRLHLVITEQGLPAAWEVLTARCHDRKGLDGLLAGRTSLDIYGDSGYHVRPKDRQQFAARDITITAAPKKNMALLPKQRACTLKRVRFKIDWALGLLSRVLLIQQTLARKARTLYERISFCLAAFNVAAWINAIFLRPRFAIKSLAA